MKDEAIKKAIDASVEAKAKELTEALEYAADGMNSLLITLRHEMSTQHPWDAAMTLQVLAEAVYECYDCIAVLLRLIDMIEETAEKEEWKEEVR